MVGLVTAGMSSDCVQKIFVGTVRLRVDCVRVWVVKSRPGNSSGFLLCVVTVSVFLPGNTAMKCGSHVHVIKLIPATENVSLIDLDLGHLIVSTTMPEKSQRIVVNARA